ncbi:MAG: dihydroneopterin aldolase [Chloroflexi bacterium]|nr:dihydroneopterin aldolase [Chloroflexota bacterium]
MDRITICDLAVLYRIGVPEAERASPQRLLLTIEMTADFAAAAASDDLSQTIDYYAVTQRLLRFGEGRSWKLLETLAVDMATMLLQEFRPKSVAVEVKKFIIPETRYVSVKVARERA